MKRAALYSSRTRGDNSELSGESRPGGTARATTDSWSLRIRSICHRHRGPLLFAAGLLLAMLLALLFGIKQQVPQELMQEDIDAAVLHTLETHTLPSQTARAVELVHQSVVRVNSFTDDTSEAKNAAGTKGRKSSKQAQRAHVPGDPVMPKNEKGLIGVGTGVVILDNGTILTSLHVVADAKRLVVTFYDGMESEAQLIAAQPENDLAVIRAQKLPDDLPAATLGSSSRLQPGDNVVAIGFPFGIGPSVSAGVVSGLDRRFQSVDGKHKLSRLIQFDAAVNPGNSGGPLMTEDGEVVGIVAAILNPSQQHTFIGIGFAVTIETAGAAVGIPPF